MANPEANRFLLVYRGDSLEIPAGETRIGRAMTCRLRFNDPAISRVHARFTVVDGVLTLEDMGSTNGTRVNGTMLTDPVQLSHGDQVQIGHRWLQVEVVPSALALEDEAPTTIDRKDDDWSTKTRLPNEGEEETLDRGTEWQAQRNSRQATEEDTIDRLPNWTESASPAPPEQTKSETFDPSIPDIAIRNCPRCRKVVASVLDVCPECGYQWPAGRPSSVTQRIKLEAIDRRVGRRKVVEIPILYASETLTLDTVARDLSRGGMFVASELLDPVNTSCEITVLPDGGPAVSLKGTVCHVVQNDAGEGGRPPGLGIRFTSLNAVAERWLNSVLDEDLSRSLWNQGSGVSSAADDD